MGVLITLTCRAPVTCRSFDPGQGFTTRTTDGGCWVRWLGWLLMRLGTGRSVPVRTSGWEISLWPPWPGLHSTGLLSGRIERVHYYDLCFCSHRNLVPPWPMASTAGTATPIRGWGQARHLLERLPRVRFVAGSILVVAGLGCISLRRRHRGSRVSHTRPPIPPLQHWRPGLGAGLWSSLV